MVEELRQALEDLDRVGQLSPDAERRIAMVISEELEQQRWDALVSTPRSRAFLHRLIAEAKQGEIEVGGLEL